MTATTTPETRQQIARFLEAHERADAQAIRELITEDATWHLPPSDTLHADRLFGLDNRTPTAAGSDQ